MPVFHTKTIESILDPVAQQVHKSIQKLHCRVVNVIIFSSSYHVLCVSCFLSIFLSIDLANLMCMGSYMTDYSYLSNKHACTLNYFGLFFHPARTYCMPARLTIFQFFSTLHTKYILI